MSAGSVRQTQAIRLAAGPEHLVHVTVILGLEDDDPLATGKRPGDAQGVDVGAGRREGVLPTRKAETFAEQLADLKGICGRQQEVVPEGGLLGDRVDDGCRCEACSHGQVAQVEVAVGVPVEIGEG